MVDIHNYKRRLERTLQRVEESTISPENKALIRKFYQRCTIDSMSLSKVERYLYDLKKFALMLNKSFLDATKDDIMEIVAKIEMSEWSVHTKHSFKVMIRKFYKIIEGSDEKGDYPERIRWLHSNIKNNQLKSPAEMLTEIEIKRMIECSEKTRDRALIACLYESGCRISEIGLIKIKDVVFDQYGAVMNVTGKTGPRRVRLVTSAFYLKEWINKHETNGNPDSYVWISTVTRKLIGYARFSDIIQRMAKRAGIEKRVYAHLFRHSRATFLANRLTEAQMKSYLGWTQSSKMAAIYVHLSGRDTDAAILGINGIELEEKKEENSQLIPKECLRCKKRYSSTTRFCDQCGLILDNEEAQKIIKVELERREMDEFMNKIVENKDVLKQLMEKMKK